MTIERISSISNANMYVLYDDNGKPIGQSEHVIGGHNAGKTYYYTLGSIPLAQIKRYFKTAKRV